MTMQDAAIDRAGLALLEYGAESDPAAALVSLLADLELWADMQKYSWPQALAYAHLWATDDQPSETNRTDG